MNILPTEVELFAIRCSINQTVNISDINHIVIITDAIHAAEKILDSSCYLHQLHTITISYKLKTFFQANPTNSMAFWDCSSNDKWLPYYAINRETKIHTIQPLYPSQVLQELSKKDECNEYIKIQQMYFQASDYKGKHFLDLDNYNQTIASTYSNRGAQLKYTSNPTH